MRKCILAGIFLLATATAALAADIALPEPSKTGGPTVLAAIESRSSAPSKQFPSVALNMEELSTLLWAASGRNRGGSGWSVPTAMHRDPYCDIYLATDEGVLLYLPKEHALRPIGKENIKALIAVQNFAQNAPQVLIFVAKAKALETFPEHEQRLGYSNVLVGSMTQNIYLAAEALDVGVRYVASLHADAIRDKLKLDKGDLPIAIMPIGKK